MSKEALITELEMLKFFNQRAGRELWQSKPENIQDEDIERAEKILTAAIDEILKYMGNQQFEFPETWEEYEKQNGFTDTEEFYTNGARLIPSFRVEQWLAHINQKTPMIDKSNFDPRQYKADLQTTFECGQEKYKAFCEWVASEVTNEESWEVNSDSFAEIACRKLHKLGIVDKQGDSWVYKE